MRVKLEHRIGVQAPAEVIWEILSDLPAWSEWNPVYPEAAGTIRYNEKLSLTEVLSGGRPHALTAPILDWAPNEALHLRFSRMGGLLTGIRYLEIEKLSETGCAFSNGDLFTGIVGPFIARRMRRTLRRTYAELGEAMKTRAEARWREGGGGAT
jgi:hypothetical protein